MELRILSTGPSNLNGSTCTLGYTILKVMILFCVMSACKLASERSFSALTRIKTYLRATMSQTRLNSLMVLHVHKEMTDKLNLHQIANIFVNNKPEHRFNIFGKIISTLLLILFTFLVICCYIRI